MITNVQIEGFKAIDKTSLLFKPITILTGTNSSGKSSALQGILKVQAGIEGARNFENGRERNQDMSFTQNANAITKFKNVIQPMSEIRNRITNSKKIKISIGYHNQHEIIFEQKEDVSHQLSFSSGNDFSFFTELHYLSANREPIDRDTNIVGMHDGYVDSLGQNTTFVLVKNRNLLLRNAVCQNQNVRTLDYQLDYWLSKIVQQKIKSIAELVEIKESVTFFYEMNDVSNIAPDSVGTGQNHIVHILLMCLLAKEGEIVIIENPELHLHPKAQAALSEFFTMIANAGIQLIIETHSEHIIHKFCHKVFKKELDHNNIIIHYKESVEQDFETIYINKRGHYSDEEGNAVMFPGGFFDATLIEILEVS